MKLATVLVALYRAGPFLAAKLENLRCQTAFADCWIVLLNCGNEDGEEDLYRAWAATHPNVVVRRYDSFISLYDSWNHGLQMTDSTYVLNSNVDDLLHPDYIERCTRFLGDHPDYACVSSQVLVT